MPEVTVTSAADTHALRRRILRDSVANADVHFVQDDDPATFHLGYVAGDELVGIATFTPAETPYRGGASAWQLRGMAVDDAQQGKGVGAAIIDEAVDRLRAEGASVLWCNARDSAAAFYKKLGFGTEGEGFSTKATGLPHHVMVLDL